MKLKQLEKLRTDLVELLEYINYMNDEFGEYCLALYNLGSSTHYMPKEFVKIYLEEVERNLIYIRQNTEWRTRKEVTTNKYKELKWIPCM